MSGFNNPVVSLRNLADLAAAIAEALGGAGIPQVANPSPLYQVATAGSPVMFGSNNASFAGQVAAGVNGMTSAIAYDSSSEGVNGWPAAWPGSGGPFAAGVTVPTININPDIPSTVSGQNDALIAAFLAGAPNGARIMAYHECNLQSNNLNPADIQTLDTYLIAKVHAANPTLLYGRGLATSPVNNGGIDPTPFITPNMDFYGVDGYQHSNANLTPKSVFDTTINAILAVQPNAAVHIIETGTALDVGTWFGQVSAYAIQKGVKGVQSYFGAGGGGSQPFNPTTMVAPMNACSLALSTAATTTTIGAGHTVTLAPLGAIASPVAGYAMADGLSYDITVNLIAGSGSTVPFVQLLLAWFDSDSASAQSVARQAWLLPMGASGTIGTNIRGRGPQTGQYLKISAQNLDTVTCTIQVQVNSVSRTVADHRWLWDAAGSQNVPTYNLVPDGLGIANCLGAVQSFSVPANSSKSWLCGLYSGRAYVRFGSGASTPVIEVTLTPQPQSVFGSVLLGEELTGQADPDIGDFTGELILPRAPCLITFTNTDSSAHDVSAMITTLDGP